MRILGFNFPPIFNVFTSRLSKNLLEKPCFWISSITRKLPHSLSKSLEIFGNN